MIAIPDGLVKQTPIIGSAYGFYKTTKRVHNILIVLTIKNKILINF